MIYSGYIECGLEEATYEFDSEETLDPIQQLDYLISSGILQIIDSPPREDDEEEDE